jgi:hypothetical protein
MFHYILSQYHLQEKDWLYSDSSPVQVGHHFELKVKLSQPATKCTSCQGLNSIGMAQHRTQERCS